MRTLVTRGEVNEDLAIEIFDLHLEAPLETLDPDRRTMLATAFEYGSTAYDAAFIALALSHDVPLVTAERTTTSWVAKLGDRIEPVR